MDASMHLAPYACIGNGCKHAPRTICMHWEWMQACTSHSLSVLGFRGWSGEVFPECACGTACTDPHARTHGANRCVGVEDRLRCAVNGVAWRGSGRLRAPPRLLVSLLLLLLGHAHLRYVYMIWVYGYMGSCLLRFAHLCRATHKMCGHICTFISAHIICGHICTFISEHVICA